MSLQIANGSASRICCRQSTPQEGNADARQMEQLLKLYQPMLTKQATIGGVLDQDVYSELCDEFVSAVREFRAPDLEGMV